MINESIRQLGIYILFFEKADQTIECLESFLPSNVDIFILNNGSSVQSTEILEGFCKPYPQIKIFSSPDNLGVSKGRNYLVRNTDKPWMFFVDNDIIMETADWADKVLEKIRRYPQCDAIVPRMYQAHEDCYATRVVMRIRRMKLVMEKAGRASASNVFPGGASIINRKVFDRLGFYEERFFSAYEDFELAIRGLVSGQPIHAIFEDHIKIIHAHRVSEKTEDKHAALVRYNLNRTRQCVDLIREKYNLDCQWGDIDQWLYEQIQQMIADYRGLPLPELHELVDLLVQVNAKQQEQIEALRRQTLRGMAKRLVQVFYPGFRRP